MKIKIRKKDLKILPGMKMKIQTVRETGSVLICAETVRSSDKVRYEVPCEIEQDGDVLLKSESIFSRLGDEIAICNTTKTVSITDGKVTFKEPCVTGEDVFFPEYDTAAEQTVSGIKVPRVHLIRAIKGLCPTKHQYCVNYNGNGKMEIVATDGTQLAKLDIEVAGVPSRSFNAVIREENADNLVHFLEAEEDETVEIIVGNFLVVVGASWEYCIPTVDVVYPNYDALIKKLKARNTIEVDASEMVFALECASIKSGEEIILEEKDDGTYMMSESEDGSFGPYKISNDKLGMKYIRLAPKKLLGGVKKYHFVNGDTKIPLAFQKDDKSAVFIEGKGYLHVLMPVLKGVHQNEKGQK